MTDTTRSQETMTQMLQPFYHLRYVLARPLQLRLLPSFVPVVPLPYIKNVPYITVGHILLMMPWMILFIVGYHKSFNNAELGGSGNIASYAILAAFFTANKANSVFAFFFGLSFERMVPLHNLYACLAVILSVFHGVSSNDYRALFRGARGYNSRD